ncbi:DUF1491 family protein [Thermaurantiacus sp.]
MTPALPASLMVPALLRRVFAAGGYATVLAKGHAGGSAMLLVHRLADGDLRAYERIPDVNAGMAWRLAAEGEAAVDRLCTRARDFDPDLWIVELAVPDPARFVAGFPPAN